MDRLERAYGRALGRRAKRRLGFGRVSRAAALAAALALPLATAGAAEAQEESSAITDAFNALLAGVGKEATKDATNEGFSWAMAAIGLSGGDAGQLAAISAELEQIDADLKNINATLNAILNAIQDQTCNETQIAPSLQDAVNDVTELYDEYQTFVTNSVRTPPVPPSQAQVLAWQNEVLASVPGDLTAIHNGVYATVNANVIHQCAVSTASDWRSQNTEPSAASFLDDRPSYAQLVNIVNYYYGVMVQGATILVEAYHLQACQAAAQDDPDLHCDFTNASTSTAPSDIDQICATSTDVAVQRACLAAEEAVTNPETGDGMYERVEAWLKTAGAPYATGEAVGEDPRAFVSGELGLLSSIATSSSGAGPSSWSDSYAYLLPKDLLDFTNNATLDGEVMVHCSSPLMSTHPCGPVGAYNANFDSEMVYAGYDNWNAISAEVLLLLFEPYNDKRSGGFDASGLASDYMYSIGFSQAVKTTGLIITTPHTGKNGDTGFEAICFMDTASPRNKAKQPWCDGIAGEVEGTDNLIDSSETTWIQSSYLDTIGSYPEWYALKICVEDCNGPANVKVAPGWFVDVQQTNSAFWQFHWPMVDVSAIECQSGKPYTNPGGLLSRCGDDLQEYVDALLPPPDGDTTALAATGDATLAREQPNRNRGEHPLLTLGGRAGNEFVVQFDDERIQDFAAGGELTSAILRLSVARRGSPRRLEIVPLTGGFVEGKGKVGTGVTWNCAEDADLSDDLEQCLEEWPPAMFARAEARRPDRRDRRRGLLGWDVTEDVAAGVHAWAIRPAPKGKGRHHRGRAGAYHSREGAAELREPFRAPTLLLEREPAKPAAEPPAVDAATEPRQIPMMPLVIEATLAAPAAGQ